MDAGSLNKTKAPCRFTVPEDVDLQGACRELGKAIRKYQELLDLEENLSLGDTLTSSNS